MSGQNAPGGAVTYVDLMDLAYSANNLPDTVQAWNDLVEGIEVNASYLDGRVHAPMQEAWRGISSELAQDAVTLQNGDLTRQAGTIHKIAGVLEGFYSNMVQLADNLSLLVQEPFQLPRASGSLVAPSPPGSPPAPPSPGLWGPTETWPLPTIFRGTFTIATGTGSEASGTVVEQSSAMTMLKGTGITQNAIDWWKSAYQYEVTWYINKANELDQAAAAELQQLEPKPTPKKNPKPQPAKPPMLGGKTVTVAAWGSDPSNPDAGSLWGIAQQEYGNGNYWPLIYEANKASYGGNWGPNDIQTGWHINVPAIKHGTPIPMPPANSDTPA
jgi:hypothetical protein